METKRIEEIGEKIKEVKIAVYGDYCLDAYWILDPGGSEVSVETGLKGEAVKKQYYNLGGASNVIANIIALKPKSVQAIGVIGEDLFGREIKDQLTQLEVNIDLLITQRKDHDTVVFGKRILENKEKPRLDFGFFNKKNEAIERELIKYLEIALKQNDALIFNQQVPGSIMSDSAVKEINGLFNKYSHKIILTDTRHYGQRILNTCLKVNEIEATRIIKKNGKSKNDNLLQDLEEFAENLYKRSEKPIFITRGAEGVVGYCKNGFFVIPGIKIMKKIDPVGAGDTISSALTLCLAAGLGSVEAAEFANLAASVTVQKLFKTGTASIEDIIILNESIGHISNSNKN